MWGSFIQITNVLLLYYLIPFQPRQVIIIVDRCIFHGFLHLQHILNSDKAIAMRFSQNKDWYPALNTWNYFFKIISTSIFNVFFTNGLVLFASPCITVAVVSTFVFMKIQVQCNIVNWKMNLSNSMYKVPPRSYAT